jgi:DNA mismatch endonuclease (patch repair protein)
VADVFTKEKRSWVMSRIRGKNTKPEGFVENILLQSGFNFEKYSNMIGRPDFILKDRRVAIFTDGDFWHGYRIGPKRLSAKSEFWRKKIMANKARDRRVTAILRREGWTVVRIWEHDIKKRPDEVKAKVLELISPNSQVSR